MSTNGILATSLVGDAIKEFGQLIFTEDFANRNMAYIEDVPRFYAAVYAALENAVSYYVDHQLEIPDKPDFLKVVRSGFAIAAYRLPFAETLSLKDIVVAPFELEALGKNFRRIGHQENLETLIGVPAQFGDHYLTIQGIRCAEFIGYLVGSADENLRDALHRSLCLWYFGRDSSTQAEFDFVDEIAEEAEWVAALVIDRAQRSYLRKTN